VTEQNVTITPGQMYALLLAIDRKTDALVASEGRMEERIADHEARLRVVERREDATRRLAGFEALHERLENSISRLGERIGHVEADIAAMREHDALTSPVRTHPIAIISAAIAALAVAISVVLFAFR